MRVASSFDFCGEIRRIALAQALRGLGPDQLSSRVARLLAYATAGVCPVDDADDLDALRRHHARLAAYHAVNLGAAA